MEEKSTPVVSFSGADILNGETTVVYGLNMAVYPSDMVYIVGKVGTGKTSIIRTITAENPLGSGKATVCGYDLDRLRERDIPYLRRRMGVVFQDFQLLMDRTVEDNLYFVLKATGWKEERKISERIKQALKSVDMLTKAHKMPHQLSGGEQQRVAIARALLNDPELIVADEPTGNLDDETAEGILNLLSGINKKQGTAIIMVTHNRSICTRWPGRVFEIRNEECHELGCKTAEAETAKAAATETAATEAAMTETAATEEVATVQETAEQDSTAEQAAASEEVASEELAPEMTMEEAAPAEVAYEAAAPADETDSETSEEHDAQAEV